MKLYIVTHQDKGRGYTAMAYMIKNGDLAEVPGVVARHYGAHTGIINEAWEAIIYPSLSKADKRRLSKTYAEGQADCNELDKRNPAQSYVFTLANAAGINVREV